MGGKELHTPDDKMIETIENESPGETWRRFERDSKWWLIANAYESRFGSGIPAGIDFELQNESQLDRLFSEFMKKNDKYTLWFLERMKNIIRAKYLPKVTDKKTITSIDQESAEESFHRLTDLKKRMVFDWYWNTYGPSGSNEINFNFPSYEILLNMRGNDLDELFKRLLTQGLSHRTKSLAGVAKNTAKERYISPSGK